MTIVKNTQSAETKLYTQATSTINGRTIWLYLISTAIGNVFVVDYEQPSKEVKRFLFEALDVAEKKYKSILCGMANEKL